MIFEYGFSVVGKSHIKKGTGCQDSHCIRKLENGWVIAAVADGVGSAKNSHIGSKIAAQTVVEFCDECMPWDYNLISIKSMMRTAYNFAYKLILREAQKSGEPIESYDTTLTMVIYDGHRIIYGHSGDGAIIGLNTFGNYVAITRPQKGADGVSVIPLRSGYTQWVIDSYDEDLAAVILVTDGMLETICPYLLRDHDKKIDRAYVALASFFADPSGITETDTSEIKDVIGRFITAEENYCSDEFYGRLTAILNTHLTEGVDEIIEKYKQNNYPIALMQNEQDDKTVVGLLNTDLALDNKEADYYSEPDWNALQDAWNRKAYPHLYANNSEPASTESDAKEETLSDVKGSASGKKEADGTVSEAAEGNTPKKQDDQTVTVSDTADDDIEIILSKRSTKNTVSSNSHVETVSTVTPTSTNAINDDGNSANNTTAVKNSTANVTTPPKHSKPKKKGVIGFLEDLFN